MSYSGSILTEKWIAEIRATCISIAKVMGLGHDDAEDIAQDVLIKLISSGNDRIAHKAYVSRAAVNRTVDFLRGKKRRNTCALDEKVPHEDYTGLTYKDIVMAEDIDVHEMMELERVVRTLSRSEQEIILATAAGNKIGSLEERYGEKEGGKAYRTKLHRIRKKLRTLAGNGESEPRGDDD